MNGPQGIVYIYQSMTPSLPIQPPDGCQRHVVLVAPEVHWNTGNIGRTCLGAGATLHLVRPLGFSLDSRQIKRAGLDYWPKVDLKVWEDFDVFVNHLMPEAKEIALFTKRGVQPYWQMPPVKRAVLIFGSETRGLPTEILHRFPGLTYYIPTTDRIRCLNLSTAVGIALYESLRPLLSAIGPNPVV